MNTYMKDRWIRHRQSAIDHLGGACTKCNSYIDLHFHHLDRTQKVATIARMSSMSEKIFWEEVDKCCLLCKDCHKLEHQIINKCGTARKYWRGCRCDPCKQAISIYHKLKRKQNEC